MRETLASIWAATGGQEQHLAAVDERGTGDLRSAFRVTDLAVAAVAGAAAAAAEYAAALGRAESAPVMIDRRRAARWFATSIDPVGWAVPSPWDAVAGDYETSDGWIKLHTNAPHHKAAALDALGLGVESRLGGSIGSVDRGLIDRGLVASAVAERAAEELEHAIVEGGGCAARMRSIGEWQVHPQGLAVASEPLVHRERTSDGSGRLDGAARLAAPGSRSRPLAGVRVLDLTRVLAGPVATRWLAALGADVLRIDPPDWDEPAVIPEVTLGKRCARLDVKLQAGRDHLVALLASADVLVHGYRPGALAGLGLDDQERDAIRPGLIDVSLDAYGWSGPWAARRGFDSLVQMSAGIAAHGMVTFGTDEPRPLPVQALDHATGYLMATAVLRSLTDRLHDGRGTRARMSLARTGSLLVSMGAPTPEGPAIVMGDEDFDPRLESTAWGALRRLRPPAEIVGTPLAWDGPAVPLGSFPPSWAHRT